MKRFVSSLSAFFLLGCGPVAARYTVDEVAIASVPMQEKQPMFSAQQEVSLAKSEKNAITSDLATTGRELELAKVEREQRGLTTQTARLEQDGAQKSHDLNAQASSAERRRVAELGERAATAKVDALSAKRRWQEKVSDVADAKIVTALAKVEYEKAKIAQAKNIMPSKDFRLETYAVEFNQRQRNLDEERIRADEKRLKFDEAVRRHQELEALYNQARTPAPAPLGVPGSAPGSL